VSLSHHSPSPQHSSDFRGIKDKHKKKTFRHYQTQRRVFLFFSVREDFLERTAAKSKTQREKMDELDHGDWKN
jgi:hypothetical protein